MIDITERKQVEEMPRFMKFASLICLNFTGWGGD